MVKLRLGLPRLIVTSIVGRVLLGGVLALTGCVGTPQSPSGRGAVNERSATTSCPSGMVQIPPGTFLMGSDDGDAKEQPAHRVTLVEFCLDRTEVTVAAYTECVRQGKCEPAPTTANWTGIKEEDKILDSQFCNGTRADRQQHPINCVDWPQADSYCRAVGKRLPTEEEWEYAARGVDGRVYPWGNEAPSASRLNTCDTECVAMGQRLGHPGWPAMFSESDGWETTAPVGSYAAGASPFGVLDMAGNVWEWTSSGSSPDYRSQRTNDKPVYRGGAWGFSDPNLVRAAYRGGSAGELRYRGADLGFRCAKSL